MCQIRRQQKKSATEQTTVNGKGFESSWALQISFSSVGPQQQFPPPPFRAHHFLIWPYSSRVLPCTAVAGDIVQPCTRIEKVEWCIHELVSSMIKTHAGGTDGGSLGYQQGSQGAGSMCSTIDCVHAITEKNKTRESLNRHKVRRRRYYSLGQEKKSMNRDAVSSRIIVRSSRGINSTIHECHVQIRSGEHDTIESRKSTGKGQYMRLVIYLCGIDDFSWMLQVPSMM